MAGDIKSKKLADKLFPEVEESEIDILDIPPEKRRLHTETYDFTVKTILDQLHAGSITIPDFQRAYVWNRVQASRLIESLIIQCPIPVIYMDQGADEVLSVIDGNQRLSSIRLFIDDGFELRGLTAYPELTGLFFSQLDPRIQRHILNRTLRSIVILKGTHPQIKYDVFERLNTGAVQLTAHELRRGLNYSEFMKEIDLLSNSKSWISVYGKRADSRMKGAELILRFCALIHDIDNYFKPLSGFLTQFSEKQKNKSTFSVKDFSKDFYNTIESIKFVYGDLAFRIFSSTNKKENNFNAALYDAQMVAFYQTRIWDNVSNINLIEFQNATAKLFEDSDFRQAISSGTSQKRLVVYRINRFTNLVKEYAAARA